MDDEQRRRRRPTVQRQALDSGSPGPAPSAVQDVLAAPGRPLDPATRTAMETRFGHDFGRVRVHADDAAAASARGVGALAYTVGDHVVFGAGRYAPESSEGRRLLAHELTHVVQQRGLPGGLQRVEAVSRPDDPSERQADAVASSVAAGRAAPAITSLGSGALQRQVDPDQPGAGGQAGDQPPEPTISRAEEVRRSQTSPGEVTGTAAPPFISLYNFPIDSARLKELHRKVLAELGDLLHEADPADVFVLVVGHADSSGDPSVNTPLSQHRALAVQRALQGRSRARVRADWAGEARPVASNDTVDGRSRNRRVDIYFLPVGGTRTDGGGDGDHKDDHDGKDEHDDRKKDDEKKKNGGRKEPEDDRTWCERHPKICRWILPIVGLGLGLGILAAILGEFLGALGTGLLTEIARRLKRCLLNPRSCLPSWPGGDGDDDDPDKKKPKKPEEPEKEKPKEPHACPIDAATDLPNEEIRARPRRFGDLWFLTHQFPMKVTFRDNPDEGCSCGCGEYMQLLKGYAERDHGTGVMERERIQLRGGLLDPAHEYEDARDGVPELPYGHRYWDPLRTQPRPNKDEDSFFDLVGLDDREHGCRYEGSDEPGMKSRTPREHLRFRFEFRGGPVDGCHGRRPVGAWHSWVVWGDFTVPPPVPPPRPPRPRIPGPSPSGGPPTHDPFVKPRPYHGPTGTSHPIYYGGGLPEQPKPHEKYGVIIRFESEGKVYRAEVEFEVIRVTGDTVELRSTNTQPLNVAPDGHKPLVLMPGTRARVSLSRLQGGGGIVAQAGPLGPVGALSAGTEIA